MASSIVVRSAPRDNCCAKVERINSCTYIHASRWLVPRLWAFFSWKCYHCVLEKAYPCFLEQTYFIHLHISFSHLLYAFEIDRPPKLHEMLFRRKLWCYFTPNVPFRAKQALPFPVSTVALNKVCRRVGGPSQGAEYALWRNYDLLLLFF